MSQSPPAALVRLHEADVVRLCGLEAAARGLDLASRHAVTATKRAGARLDATVADERACQAWIELPGEVSALSAMHWGCGCHAPPGDADDPSPPGSLACAHVAAMLTSWIHSPGDFVEPASVAAPLTGPAAIPGTPPPRSHVTQPALLSTPAPRRSRVASSLSDELTRLPTNEVMAMARRVLGAEPDERDVRPALVHALTDPARLSALLERLDPAARELLGDLMLLGGAITAADLDALAQRAGRLASALRSSVGILERHGLLFPLVGAAPTSATGVSSPWRRIAGWRMSPETRGALASQPFRVRPPQALDGSLIQPVPPNSQPSALPRFSRILRASPQPLCLAMAVLARAPEPYRVSPSAPLPRERVPSVPLSARHRPGPLLAGELDPQGLAAVARGAGVAAGVARLARRVLLWSREGGGLSPLSDIAAVPPAERVLALRAGFRLWAASDAPAELADLQLPDAPVRLCIAPAHMAWHPGLLAQEAAEARAFILRVARELPPGVWHPVDAFLETLWRLNPLFLRGRQATFAEPAWWLERPGERRPLRPQVHDEWLAGEGEYVRSLLAGPLYWWGALDLGLDATGAASAFRMTALGQFLLDRSDAPSLASLPPLEAAHTAPILPTRNGGLAVHPLAASASLFDALASWAAPTAIAGGRLVYTLSPDLACTAFDGGAAPDGLLACLRALDPSGRGRLEAPVATRLAAWRAQYGKSRISSGWALLEAQDEPTLVEALAKVPEVARRCRRVGPALALVPPADLPALRQALARREYRL